MTGVNSVKGWREGKNFIVFDDGVKMNYSTPEMRVGGIIMGDRVLNYCGNFIIKDFTHRLESNTTFSYRVIIFIFILFCRMLEKLNQLKILLRDYLNIKDRMKL